MSFSTSVVAIWNFTRIVLAPPMPSRRANRGNGMPDGKRNVTHQKLKTPYAAALAGLLFTVLFTSSYVLIRLSIPANPADAGAWLAERAGTVSLALGLLPFAGIAFLWFIGVVRDRLGPLEDQFFATVFFGSGLLFLALAFVSAALAGGILATYALEQRRFLDKAVSTTQTPFEKYQRYQRLVTTAQSLEPVITAVAHPCDQSALEGADPGGGDGAHQAHPGRSAGENDRCRAGVQ